MRLFLGIAALFIFGAGALLAEAPNDGPASPRGAKSAGKISDPALRVTPEREAAALTFVRQHHAELVDLLATLKQTNPKEYGRAMRDLFRTSERLAHTFEQDPVRYEFDLQIWKTRSCVQLLAARLKMSPRDAALIAELKQALGEQMDVQRARLEHDRALLAERVKRMDVQIERLEKNRQDIVERQFNALLNPRKKSQPEKPQAGDSDSPASNATAARAPSGK